MKKKSVFVGALCLIMLFVLSFGAYASNESFVIKVTGLTPGNEVRIGVAWLSDAGDPWSFGEKKVTVKADGSASIDYTLDLKNSPSNIVSKLWKNSIPVYVNLFLEKNSEGNWTRELRSKASYLIKNGDISVVYSREAFSETNGKTSYVWSNIFSVKVSGLTPEKKVQIGWITDDNRFVALKPKNTAVGDDGSITADYSAFLKSSGHIASILRDNQVQIYVVLQLGKGDEVRSKATYLIRDGDITITYSPEAFEHW
jgi:hypothetical protein